MAMVSQMNRRWALLVMLGVCLMVVIIGAFLLLHVTSGVPLTATHGFGLMADGGTPSIPCGGGASTNCG